MILKTPYFRSWCKHVLPLVYDDSLSYYELLCKFVAYINGCIENINEQTDNIQALYDAYQKLEDYVNNYFDTADFEKMVSDKLDEMALDGTLTKLISDLTAEINARLDTMQTDIDTKYNELRAKITFHYMRTSSSIINGNTITFRDYRRPTEGVKEETIERSQLGTLQNPYDTVEYTINKYVNAGFSDARMWISKGGYYRISRNLMSNMSLHINSNATEPVYLVFDMGDIPFNTYGCHIHFEGSSTAPLVLAYKDRLQGDYSKPNHDFIYFEGGTVSWTNVDVNTGLRLYGVNGHIDASTMKALTVGEGSNIYCSGCTFGGDELGGSTQEHIIIVETNAKLYTNVSNNRHTRFVNSPNKNRCISVYNGGLTIRDTPTVANTTVVSQRGLACGFSTVFATDESLVNLNTIGSGNLIASTCLRGGI